MVRSENEIHRILKNKIRTILERSGFEKLDSEVHVSFTDDYSDNYSMDVCAIHDKHMIIIECKKSHNDLSSAIEHALFNISNLEKGKTTRIISSDLGRINLSDIKNIENVHYGFAIAETQNKDQQIQKRLQRHNMVFWNEESVNYFHNSSTILSSAGIYEILYEFGIRPESIDIHPEDAVRVSQNGIEFFLLGIHPSRLLEMGYVFRRTSHRKGSYQRILKNTQISELTKFYKNTKDLLLANSVIIAFDADKKIQKQIHWDRDEKKLTFPTSYCCAWIIDGQHRVYGFNGTKYGKFDRFKENQFKMPVVAFKKLPSHKQSNTFVEINQYQNKIDPVLIHDIASSFPYVTQNELTWPSLLVKKLNETEPWKGLIKTTQNEPMRSITITGFVRPALLNTLLGYDRDRREYLGPLNMAAPINKRKRIDHPNNEESLMTQLSILTRFFNSVRKNAKGKSEDTDRWLNYHRYGLTRFPGVNALLLVLNAIMKKHKYANVDFDYYFTVLKKIDFSMKRIKKFSRGYGAVGELAIEIMGKVNRHTGKDYKIELPKRY